MDDGLQNPALVYDYALAVVDGRRGLGNGRVIPAGPLRAPLFDQLRRAHAVLLVGDMGAAAQHAAETAKQRGLPILRARLEPDASALAALRGKRVLAFAGIGDPDKFFLSLTAAGIVAPVALGFPDHHPYTPDDAARLLATAERESLCLVTTEKDLARMHGAPALATLRARSMALPVTLVFADADEMRRRLPMSRDL
jgi:tetraacyldisaccharide 4'-kinase